MESAAGLAGSVEVVRYATVEEFVAALEPHLRRSSWAAHLLLAPAYAPSASDCLFLATWPTTSTTTTTPAGADQRPRPVLVLARVDAFPIFVSFTDARDGNGKDEDEVVEVVGRHVTALAAYLADRVSAEWLGTVRRVTGPAWLSRPLADAVGRLLNRRPTPHWTLTAAACTSTTLRLLNQAGGASAGGGEEGEVRRFVVGRDDEERLARLYQVFVLPPTSIDECRRHVRRTLVDEPGSRVFVHVVRRPAADDDDINKGLKEVEVITGFLYLKRETPFNFGISAVCTAPEYRCRGIAGRLVRAATRWALAPADSNGGGGGKKEVCIFWMEEGPGRIYRKAGFGDDGMMGDWAGWTFEGLDPGPWPS